MYVYTVRLNGLQLAYNPTDIMFHTTNRNSSEFVSTGAGGQSQHIYTTSGSAGITPVKNTVSFTLCQQPKTRHYGGPTGTRHINEAEDYISMLQEAKTAESVVQLEVVVSLPRDYEDVSRDGNSIIWRHEGTYLVDDVSMRMDAGSPFLKTAQITFREHVPATRMIGTLQGDVIKNDLWMTFVDQTAEAERRKSSQYNAYTNSCALSWIYDLIGQSAAPGDDPRTTYPPETLSRSFAYPMGTESHLNDGELPSAPELQATETWGEMTTRYAHNMKNGIVYVAEGADRVLGRFETGVKTVMSTVYPYISTAVRIGAGVMGGSWVGLATYALRDYPWTGNLISNIHQEYNKTQNIVSSLGNGVKYSIIPEWDSIRQGLGYDADKHRKYFSKDNIPTIEAAIAAGSKTPKHE